jgi:tetratricopeptide (TPR) repeat protein
MKQLGLLMLVLILVPGWTVCLGQQEEGSTDYQYALIEAVKQKNLGNISEAVKLYRLVIQDKPDCDAAYYELGSIYLMSNQVELAVTTLQKAYDIEPGNQWYTMAYLDALGAGEQFGTMEEILKQKIKNDPDEVEWEYQLASVYYNLKKPKKAISILEDIEKERGFSEKVTLLKASIYENEEEYELARQEIEKVMVLFPEAIQFRIVAAELCLKSGMEDQAAEYYMQILDVDSTNIFALTNLTDYYRKKEDYKNSFKYLNKSFRSEQIDARRKMAILSYYLSEEQFVTNYAEELEGLINVLMEVHPEEYDIRLMASDFYIQIRAYEKAYLNLKAYMEAKGATYPLYMQAVLLANASGLNRELVEITGKALKTYPDSSDIRFFRGVGLYELGDYKALIQNFDSVSIEKYSNKEYISQSKMLYAEALYRLEDFPKSDSIFELLISEEPDNYMVLNNYSYYLAERGEKLKQAETWSRVAIKNNPDNATFLDTHAWVLYKLKAYEEAELYIMKAMEKGGENDPEINEHAGDIQVALRSVDIARSYYMKAIILGGDKERIQEKIDSLKTGNGE